MCVFALPVREVLLARVGHLRAPSIESTFDLTTVYPHHVADANMRSISVLAIERVFAIIAIEHMFVRTRVTGSR